MDAWCCLSNISSLSFYFTNAGHNNTENLRIAAQIKSKKRDPKGPLQIGGMAEAERLNYARLQRCVGFASLLHGPGVECTIMRK